MLPRVYHVLMLGLDRSEKSSSLGLHSTTRYGDAPTRAGPVGGTSRLVGALGVIRAELWVLSLSMEEGICLPLAVWQESWPNFKGLPKVSEVATDHWVFLKCDWSLVSS